MNFIDGVFGKKTKVLPDSARPTSGSIMVKGSMISKRECIKLLSGIAAIDHVENVEGNICAIIVESSDRNRKPYLYVKLRIGKDAAVAEYSITPEVANPYMRRLSILGTLFSVISILETKNAFRPMHSDMYERMAEAAKIAAGLVSADSLKLRYELDMGTHENTKLREENARINDEKEGLGFQCMELERKLEQCEARIEALERMTDSELDSEILKWVDEHSGKLHGENFCTVHSIGMARLDERLDSLSKRGVVRFA